MKYPMGFAILFSPQLLAGVSNMTKNTYYIYIHKYAPCHFVSSKKECVVAYTFLQDIFVLRLICTKFIFCAQREIKNGGQVPVCFIVVCPELKATCYE